MIHSINNQNFASMKKLILVSIGLLLLTGKGAAQFRLSTAELKQRMALNDPALYRKSRTAINTLSGVGSNVPNNQPSPYLQLNATRNGLAFVF